MTSRERLQATLRHQTPDRVPVDFGATSVTGMHVLTVARLRRAVLGDLDWRVKVIEPFQMLGEIDDALREALGIDTVPVFGRTTMFGFENRDWKPFPFMGEEVLVPQNFNVTEDANGDQLMYPQGDTSAPPSGRMPKGAFFFDAIIRQDPIHEDTLDPADNMEEFSPLGAADLAHFRRGAERVRGEERGVVLSVPGSAFGDIALVPAVWLRHPKGIRDVAEWYMATATRPDYIRAVFERQCEVALQTIDTLAEIFGDSVDVAVVTGTDFGTQRGPFLSKKSYRDLFMPFHKRVNERIHGTTGWKTFMHSCGGVYPLIPDFIEAGFDILNPVQCSAADMGPERLKREFGKDVVFWGGGVDTQKTMAFGAPAEVYREVRERLNTFGEGGGFVFNAIHNLQGNTPIENVLAMFDAIRDHNAC